MPGKNKKYFYQLSIEEAAARLKTHLKSGLSPKEAEKRLKIYGPNQLQEGKKRPVFFRLTDQFKDPLILVLIVAAFLAFYLHDVRGGTILLIIVFINALIGFYQEFKAEKILESLKAIIKDKAIVIRDGKRFEIPQAQIVPGDLVYLEEGSSIPADLRLSEVTHFSTNDFILTGESGPQEKYAEKIIPEKTTLTNQDNLVFMGLTVAKGNAYGLVFGTGMDTAIGRIATATQDITHDLSPLQKEMNALAKLLTKVAGLIALSLFIINLYLNFKGGEPLGMAFQASLLFAISIAAACVPQGLPAQISVALSLGVGRLAQKKAIVKKLSAVETLGATTVICTDKTGTLTKNEMTITDAVIFESPNEGIITPRLLEITGEGYHPQGHILEKGKHLNSSALEDLKQFFEDGFLASNGRAEPPDQTHRDWYALGDPTEAAFTPLAMKAGLQPELLEKKFPLLHELPFDSVRKRMTVIRAHKGKHIGYMKGAIESVLAACDQMRIGTKVKKLTPRLRQQILEEAAQFSVKALRVLALAYRDFPSEKEHFSLQEDEKKFVFSGFVAMIDPPRSGVKEAIEKAYQAGIKVMMITGDNPITARAIAEKIGMTNGSKPLDLFSGDDIKTLSDPKLKKILEARSIIFSRVSPQDKYRLVKLLKEMGHVVAVTGDGVNDTLSLKRADIGVAMGKMGSEVAKEASEIVLLDDNFKTLTTAITEGRTIFKNLKKTVIATVTANMGELACVLIGFVGLMYGLPLPITAIQILAVDLIAEILPLTALTFDPADKKILQEKPRRLQDHILNRYSFSSIVFFGLCHGAVAFSSFLVVYKNTGSVPQGQAAAYAGLVLCQLVNILSDRSEQTLFSRYLFTNAKLWGSILISGAAVWCLIHLPWIGKWFGFEPMGWKGWLVPMLGAMVILALHELWKGLIRKKILKPLI